MLRQAARRYVPTSSEVRVIKCTQVPILDRIYWQSDTAIFSHLDLVGSLHLFHSLAVVRVSNTDRIVVSIDAGRPPSLSTQIRKVRRHLGGDVLRNGQPKRPLLGALEVEVGDVCRRRCGNLRSIHTCQLAEFYVVFAHTCMGRLAAAGPHGLNSHGRLLRRLVHLRGCHSLSPLACARSRRPAIRGRARRRDSRRGSLSGWRHSVEHAESAPKRTRRRERCEEREQ